MKYFFCTNAVQLLYKNN